MGPGSAGCCLSVEISWLSAAGRHCAGVLLLSTDVLWWSSVEGRYNAYIPNVTFMWRKENPKIYGWKNKHLIQIGFELFKSIPGPFSFFKFSVDSKSFYLFLFKYKQVVLLQSQALKNKIWAITWTRPGPDLTWPWQQVPIHALFEVVRSHTVMVWSHLWPKKILVVSGVGGRPN